MPLVLKSGHKHSCRTIVENRKSRSKRRKEKKKKNNVSIVVLV